MLRPGVSSSSSSSGNFSSQGGSVLTAIMAAAAISNPALMSSNNLLTALSQYYLTAAAAATATASLPSGSFNQTDPVDLSSSGQFSAMQAALFSAPSFLLNPNQQIQPDLSALFISGKENNISQETTTNKEQFAKQSKATAGKETSHCQAQPSSSSLSNEQSQNNSSRISYEQANKSFNKTRARKIKTEPSSDQQQSNFTNIEANQLLNLETKNEFSLAVSSSSESKFIY